MIQAYAFDVNETLLDLKALRPAFAELIGSADYLGEWLATIHEKSILDVHSVCANNLTWLASDGHPS